MHSQNFPSLRKTSFKSMQKSCSEPGKRDLLELSPHPAAAHLPIKARGRSRPLLQGELANKAAQCTFWKGSSEFYGGIRMVLHFVCEFPKFQLQTRAGWQTKPQFAK